MTELTIRQVDRSRAQAVETLGSKPKFWFRDDDQRYLFKAEDRGTGEDWAEVIACHFCRLIGLPHVEYELAAEYDGGQYVRPGVVCANMAPKPVELVLGNQLLLAIDADYPASQRFKVRQHTVEAVIQVMWLLDPCAAILMEGVPNLVKLPLDVFVGYVMLDAWIGNQDRHHENWAALSDGNFMRLAPTFDHGAALARNLLDSEREDRLRTKDRNRTVPAFAERGRSAFYGSPTDSRPLGLLEAFLAFAQYAPAAAAAWTERLQAVKSDDVLAILDRVPLERMSAVCKRFTMELLTTNRLRLLK